MSAAIMRVVEEVLDPMTDDVRAFWEVVAEIAPWSPRAGEIADRLGVLESSFNSRFYRQGLPSPNAFLVAWRLCLAAELFDQRHRTIAEVAYALHHASPQSFGRHLRTYRGITCTEFRERCSFAGELARFRAMLEETAPKWVEFTPVSGMRKLVAA